MEGRVLVVCAECGRRREVSGEMPDEYRRCFAQIVEADGFVPRPGVELVLICGQCAKGYEGHETVDDEEKIRG